MYYSSLAVMHKEEEINSYIDKLRKKYKIKVEEIYIIGHKPSRPSTKLKEVDNFFEKVFFNNDKLFKLIKVGRTSILLIRKDIYLLA